MVKASTDWDKVVADARPAADREAGARGLDPRPHQGARARRAARGLPLAAKFDDLVLAEEFVAGQELTASILGRRARCR